MEKVKVKLEDIKINLNKNVKPFNDMTSDIIDYFMDIGFKTSPISTELYDKGSDFITCQWFINAPNVKGDNKFGWAYINTITGDFYFRLANAETIHKHEQYKGQQWYDDLLKLIFKEEE